MSQQPIAVGTVANDGTGDPLRSAMQKVNAMFTELYTAADSLSAQLATKAPLASPGLTGSPTAPTASQGDNSTKLANTAFVRAAIADVIASSPSTLDTLNELAAALGNDPNFATTIANALGLKAALDSPNLTGAPTAPTAAAGNNTTLIATTAFVTAALAALLATTNTYSKAQIISPVSATGVSGNITPNAQTSNSFRYVLSGATTLLNPSNPTNGQVLNFRLKQDGTGGRVITWPTKFKWPNASVPVLSTGANAVDFLSAYYDATDDRYECVLVKGLG